MTSKETEKKLAVYTTYCGTSKNKTFKAKPVDSEFKHFFISNNQDILSEATRAGWTPIYLEVEVSENVVLSALQAKVGKSIPHKFPQLNEFEFTFYKDDKLDIDLEKIVKSMSILEDSNACLAIRPHYFLGKNILFEFGEAMLQPRYKVEWEQSVSYITEQLANGYKLECQLYWTSAILRSMRHPDIQSLNETWFYHIDRCGIECQISFNFVAQRFSTIVLLPLDLSKLNQL